MFPLTDEKIQIVQLLNSNLQHIHDVIAAETALLFRATTCQRTLVAMLYEGALILKDQKCLFQTVDLCFCV